MSDPWANFATPNGRAGGGNAHQRRVRRRARERAMAALAGHLFGELGRLLRDPTDLLATMRARPR